MSSLLGRLLKLSALHCLQRPLCSCTPCCQLPRHCACAAIPGGPSACTAMWLNLASFSLLLSCLCRGFGGACAACIGEENPVHAAAWVVSCREALAGALDRRRLLAGSSCSEAVEASGVAGRLKDIRWLLGWVDMGRCSEGWWLPRLSKHEAGARGGV